MPPAPVLRRVSHELLFSPCVVVLRSRPFLDQPPLRFRLLFLIFECPHSDFSRFRTCTPRCQGSLFPASPWRDQRDLKNPETNFFVKLPYGVFPPWRVRHRLPASSAPGQDVKRLPLLDLVNSWNTRTSAMQFFTLALTRSSVPDWVPPYSP